MRRKYPPIKPGDKFGKLTVIREARHGYINGDGINYVRRFLCRCACGRELFASCSYLNSGHRKSCAVGPCRGKTHGMFAGSHRNRFTAASYYAMVHRCTNPRDNHWDDYGGANPPVTVCERWLGAGGFLRFLKDMGARPVGKTLDRKNPFGNYEPSNCRWASPKTQANNQRRHYPDGWKDDFGAPQVDPLNPEAGAF